jgi:hypothetical protein
MKFKEYLQEEYITSFNAGRLYGFDGGYTEIFKNPSKKELSDLVKKKINIIRFFVDFDTNDIYVWQAETIHHETLQQLKKDGINLRNYFQGVAAIKSGKIHEVDSDNDLWDVPIVVRNGMEQEREPNEEELKIINKRIVLL